MPHWAEIDSINSVIRVTYGNGTDKETFQWLKANLGGEWVRTYYNTVGKTFAGVGYTYDSVTGDFIAPLLVPAVLAQPTPEILLQTEESIPAAEPNANDVNATDTTGTASEAATSGAEEVLETPEPDGL